MANSVPVALYGRDFKIAEAVQEKLLPDIDVVHSCLLLSAAETELPALCSGDLSTVPSSGLGSNVGVPESERRVPKAIFFGGAISDEESTQVKKAIIEKAGADAVRFLRVSRDDVLELGGTTPDPDIIAQVYRKKVEGL